MPKQLIGGAPHRLALEMSEELARPNKPPLETFRRAEQPFVNGVRAAVAGLQGVARKAAVEEMGRARQEQVRGWLAARAHLFRRAGFEPRVEGLDELVLRCKGCGDERVLVAGQMPTVSQLRCPCPKGE